MQNLKNRIRIVVHNCCVFFRQAKVRRLIVQAMQVLIAVIIVAFLLRFIWWFGFMLPSERDKYEATKAQSSGNSRCKNMKKLVNLSKGITSNNKRLQVNYITYEVI